ncbi:MAG: 5-formyltetrahydrofolate cyclo-ligase [Acutalibacteraceae bacterium]
MQIINIKNSLRKKYKNIRNNLIDRNKKDLEILNRLKESKIYINCDSVLIYVSTEIEVDTHNLIEFLFNQGIKVAVPQCDTEKNTMEFYFINSMSDLICGAYNIPEPDISHCIKVSNTSNSLCIVPGLSFDQSGYRLGFGKGYYDRFLSKSDCLTVGLCYEECLCENLPHDNFDKRVSVVITENNIYNCNQNS